MIGIIFISLSAGAMLGMMLGALLKGGSNYSRGFDAGFAAGSEAALGEPLDDREVIPAEGSPFVREMPPQIVTMGDDLRREHPVFSATS